MTSSKRLILASSCAILLAPFAFADDPSVFVWDGNDGSNTAFTHGLNWATDVAPDGNDVLLFGDVINRTVTDINGYNGFRIFFLAGSQSYTLTGTGATLFDFGADNNNGGLYSAGANAPKIENNSSSLQTINVPLTLNGGGLDHSEINPVDGDLLFGSTVAITGGEQLRVWGNNGKTVTFNGIISGANSSVAINQNSNVVYGAVNTYSGDTFINAGSLGFSATGGLTGGTLQLGDTSGAAAAALRILDTDGGTTIARPIVVRAGSSGVKTIGTTNTSGTNTFSGTVALNDDLTVNVADANGALTVSGVVSGAETLTKTGDGLLTLSGANAFGGGLIVSGGRVRITVSNTIGGGIRLNTGGILELNTAGGDNTTFNNFLGVTNNAFTFDGGTLLMSAATTAVIDRTFTNRNVAVNTGGATFDIQGSYTNFNEGILNQLRFAGTSVFSGSGTITKDGGGRLQLQNTAATFTGPVILNNGTLEASGSAVGTAVATNTVTVNGGNWALSGDASQAITLNGGAISTNGGSRTVNGAINVTGGSYIFLNEFWRDFDTNTPGAVLLRNLTVNGVVSGNGSLAIAVNRQGWTSNNGTTILRNAGNTYSGTITVGKNLRLESNSATGAGSTLGSAAIVLAGGGLNLRDNGVGNDAVLSYGNNVSLANPSGILDRGTLAGTYFIDVNRSSGTNTGNTIQLGSLTMGNQPLAITGSNGYGLAFSGPALITSNATINAASAPLTLGGGLTEGQTGLTLTKNGAAALILTSEASHTGATNVNGGSLILRGADGRLNGTATLALAGATLQLDNSAVNHADRVADATDLRLSNSTIGLSSLVGAPTASGETLGDVELVSGVNAFSITQGNAGAMAVLTVNSLTRQNGAALRVSGANLGLLGTGARVVLAGQLTDIPLMESWITVNGTDFAQYVTAQDGGVSRGITVADYVTDPADDTAFAANQNLRLTGTATTSLTAPRSIGSVNFANVADTRVLALGDHQLVVQSGGLLVGTNAASITGSAASALTSGGPELIITNNAALGISAPITNNGVSEVGLLKTGNGTLTLSATNTFTGDLVAAQGTIAINTIANAGAASAIGAGDQVTLGTGGLTTLQYTGPTIATNRALVVGSSGAIMNVSTAGTTLEWDGTTTSSGPLTKAGPGTLTLDGTATISGNVSVNTGVLNFGKSANISGGFTVGAATATFSGPTTVIAGTLNVGSTVPGTSLMTAAGGGSLSVGTGSGHDINIGFESTAITTSMTGSVNLSGLNSFTANVANIRVGGQAATGGDNGGADTGTLILAQNNTITASGSIVVADSPGNGDAGTRGTLTFGSGLNDVTTPTLTIGGRKYGGVSTIAPGGTLQLDNGTTRASLNVGANNVGTGATPISSFDLSGGSIIANLNNVVVGLRAGGDNGDTTATLNLGTSATTNVNINVATGVALRVGALDFSGGTQPSNQLAAGTVVIGGDTVLITSSVTTSSAVVIGHFNNTGTALNAATQANAATGTLTITGGAVTVNASGPSSINLAPRAVVAGSADTNTSTGALNISGGSLTVNNHIQGNSTVVGTNSTINLSGGLLNMAGRNLTDIKNLNFTGGTIRNLGTLNRPLTQTGENSLLDVAANNATISGAYSVTDGNVNIAATRIFATSGTVLDGTSTLVVNGTLQGSLTANAGSTVMGSGTTAALNLAGGTIAPGNSPGILNAGNLSLAGGTLAFELNGTTAGTGYDQINVTGTVGLSANTDFTLSFGFVPPINSTFTLINNDLADPLSITNGALFRFAGNAIPDDTRFTTAQGYEFELNYNGGSSLNDVVLTTVVPEPASAMMLLAGCGLLAGFRRSRRSRHER